MLYFPLLEIVIDLIMFNHICLFDKNSKISKFTFAKFRNLQIDFKVGIEETSLPPKKDQAGLGNTNMLRWDVFPWDYEGGSPLCLFMRCNPFNRSVNQLLRHDTFGIRLARIIDEKAKGEELLIKGKMTILPI